MKNGLGGLKRGWCHHRCPFWSTEAQRRSFLYKKALGKMTRLYLSYFVGPRRPNEISETSGELKFFSRVSCDQQFSGGANIAIC